MKQNKNDVMFPGFKRGHMPIKACDADTTITITVNDATVLRDG